MHNNTEKGLTPQTGPAEVITLAEFQQRMSQGKTIEPGTLVLVPATLLSEMRAGLHRASVERGQPPHKSDSSDIVEMTYVGQHTRTHLWVVQQGQETLATLSWRRRILGNIPGDACLSLDEAINILERSQGIQKTTEELKAEVAHYTTALKNIEREPDAYVTPEIARGWYEQQIERIHQLLQVQVTQVESR